MRLAFDAAKFDRQAERDRRDQMRAVNPKGYAELVGREIAEDDAKAAARATPPPSPRPPVVVARPTSSRCICGHGPKNHDPRDGWRCDACRCTNLEFASSPRRSGRVEIRVRR